MYETDAESCRRPQHDVTTRRHDNDDDDDDVIGEYSGHLSVAVPTPAATHQSAARESGRHGLVWSQDVNTVYGSWSQTNRKSMKPEEVANGAAPGDSVVIGHALLCWLVCLVSAQLIVSTLL